MSLIGAMSAAVSGIAAQSSAFGNISDNIANSQTVGFKRVDTSFVDYLSTSTALQNEPSTVVARPDYVNTVQGTITQTDNTLGMAITGQGFFAVSHPTGVDATGKTQFAAQSYYTRADDFQLDKSGFLINSSGEYLNGWIANQTTGVLNKSTTQPIQVGQSVYKPVATQNMTMQANLPSNLIASYTPAAAGPPATAAVMLDAAGNAVPAIQPQVAIYDASGAAHTVQYTWTPVNTAAPPAVLANNWTLSATLLGATAATNVNLGSANVTFNADGTLATIAPAAAPTNAAPIANPTISTPLVAGDPVTIRFDTGLNTAVAGVTQPITLSLGSLGSTNGLTQFSATGFTLRSLTQDGVPPGSFSSISTKASGDIYANYDNGQTRLIARVPVATFGNPDALQRQNGSSFTVTRDSGNPSLQDAGTNGSGGIVVQSVEGSNVDIGSEFTKLIVAQRAYSANAKVVTTADELMQTTLDMKR